MSFAAQHGCVPLAVKHLRMCHRQCYMQSLAKIQNPDGIVKEVVPRNRCFGERLRVPKIEHRILKKFKCLVEI